MKDPLPEVERLQLVYEVQRPGMTLSEQIAIQLTDPSKELSELGKFLRNYNKPEKNRPFPIFEALAKIFDVKADDPILLELIGAINTRLHGLSDFAKKLDQSELEESQRQDAINACAKFAQLFHPRHASMDWNDGKSQFIQDADLTALRWFSRLARQYRPLRLVAESDRNELIHQISDAIARLQQSGEPSWTTVPLIDGLERLTKILRYLPYFGYEAALDQLLLLRQQATIIEAQAAKESGRDHLGAVREVLMILALAGNLYCLPDQVATATDRYKGWLVAHMTDTVQPEAPLALPPPKAIVREDDDAETGGTERK